MIDLDIRNVLQDRVGPDHGLDWASEAKAKGPELEAAVRALRSRAADPEAMLGWTALPADHALADAVTSAAAELAAFATDLVVLGIGGSSLGAQTVVRALQHPQRMLQADGHGMRVHLVDNVDPDVIHGLLHTLDPARTVVNVISKSGTTAETMAAWLAFRAWLRTALGDGYARHVVVTTDPSAGVLRPLAEERGYRSFGVPPSVGGRFSVFSAVGLLPIAAAGIDVHALLAGAAEAEASVDQPFDANPAARATLIHALLARRGKTQNVLMPYATRLKDLGAWYVQLWAESLGKAVDRSGSTVHAGTTPIPAVGATDQHAQVQLFNEGPNDKVVAFVRVAAFDHPLAIPDAEPEVAGLAYLAGAEFGSLLLAEQAATAHALASHRRPNYTWRLPAVDARSLGELMQLLMWQTALMGELLGIDAFDQPGVELGKRYTYALMGRSGFEDLRKELAEAGVEA